MTFRLATAVWAACAGRGDQVIIIKAYEINPKMVVFAQDQRGRRIGTAGRSLSVEDSNRTSNAKVA
jgi:hypothetical protein